MRLLVRFGRLRIIYKTFKKISIDTLYVDMIEDVSSFGSWRMPSLMVINSQHFYVLYSI
jgi:hypothetical protein